MASKLGGIMFEITTLKGQLVKIQEKKLAYCCPTLRLLMFKDAIFYFIKWLSEETTFTISNTSIFSKLVFTQAELTI